MITGSKIRLRDKRLADARGVSFLEVLVAMIIISVSLLLLLNLAMIALDGNDRYYAQTDHCLGAGFMGCGILDDWAGDDIYIANHFSLGCGLFGTGILIDRGGDDLRVTGGFRIVPPVSFGHRLYAAGMTRGETGPAISVCPATQQ